jgi:diadenylate cyclase
MSLNANILESIFIHLKNLTFSGLFLTALDIIIVSILAYYAFILIKGTKATRIFYGVLILAIILVIGRILKLETLNWVLSHLTTLVLVAIPIVFQPELRRGLEKLGRIKIFGGNVFFEKRMKGRVINEILQAIKVLKKNRVGAIISLQRKTGLAEYAETGTELNSKLTSKLILTIFYPKSPLHDGAIIVSGDKILSAGCILPLSDSEIGYKYGTRHRAALGLSESTDAVSIVVSEERGEALLVYNGEIKENMSIDEIEEELGELFG